MLNAALCSSADVKQAYITVCVSYVTHKECVCRKSLLPNDDALSWEWYLWY